MHMFSAFANVTSLSFAGCLMSFGDLLLVSLCTQKLNSLTLTDRLLDHDLPEGDIDPSQIKDFRILEKQGLIKHRLKIISYVKILWPTLQHLTLL
uniref:Secreted protein n=1 Tax=Angiostrongylus cantonensis TaxID=6313 RepID=A0A0K0DRX0_ANGCA